MLGIGLACEPKQAATALEAAIAELRKLAEEPVGDAELTKAVEYTKGRLLLGLESTSALCEYAGQQLLLQGQILEPEELVARIESVDAAQVRALAGAAARLGSARRGRRTVPQRDEASRRRSRDARVSDLRAVSLERTLVLVKPDGVQRRLVGEVIGRFERRGLHLVALKLMRIDRALAERHYARARGKPFFDGLVVFITSAPVVAMVWEGADAVAQVRAMMGATNPTAAAPGSIRGDLAVNIGNNVVHGSDSPGRGAEEVALFFTPDELIEWSAVDTDVGQRLSAGLRAVVVGAVRAAAPRRMRRRRQRHASNAAMPSAGNRKLGRRRRLERRSRTEATEVVERPDAQDRLGENVLARDQPEHARVAREVAVVAHDEILVRRDGDRLRRRGGLAVDHAAVLERRPRLAAGTAR